MPNLALIVAMRTEVPHMLRNTTDICQIGNNIVKVAVTGIGPKKARCATQQVCSGSLGFSPDLLINSGFCGAVGGKLDAGHLFLADLVAYREREIELVNSPYEKVLDLLEGFEHQVGKLQTFNWPVLSRARVADGALAVDMEAFAIAQTAATYRVPVIIIKAVIDRVPQHTGLFSLLAQVRGIKINSKKARANLNGIVNKICEGLKLGIEP